MPWFSKSRKQLADELAIARVVIGELRFQTEGLKQQVQEFQIAGKLRDRELAASKEAQQRIEQLLTTERDYWRRTAEVMLDKQSIRDDGLPIFRLPPEIKTEPAPESQTEEQSEAIPAHARRNPRAFVHNATLQKTVEFNRANIRSSADSMRAALSAIDREAAHRASTISAVPSAPTTATISTEENAG